MKNYKKLKLKQNRALLISFILVIFFNNGFSQNCPFKKDTVYIVSFTYVKKHYQPLVTGGLTKNIKFITKTNADSIIKDFFQNAIYINEPLISLGSNLKCFSDTSEAKESYNFTAQIIAEKLSNIDTTIIIKCKKKTTLQISFSKIIADFWIVPTNFNKINGLSVGYPLTPSIYKNDFYYGLKYLYDVLILSKEDKIQIRNLH